MKDKGHVFKVNFELGITAHNEYQMKIKKNLKVEADDTIKVMIAEGNLIIWINNSFYGIPFHDPIIDNEEFEITLLLKNKGD